MMIATGVIFQLQRRTKGDVAKKMYDSYRPKMWEKAQRDGAKFRYYLDKYGVMPFYMWQEDKMWQYREAFFNESLTQGFKHKMSAGKFLSFDTRVTNLSDILKS